MGSLLKENFSWYFGMHYHSSILFVFMFMIVITSCFSQSTSNYQQQYALDARNKQANSLFENTNHSYRIRVKQPISPCQREYTTQYSGYIDNLITNEHIFFYFLESQLAPKTDPVILLLHGDLGCSPVSNSWFETGLCSVKTGIETNPYSFNNIANLLYIDQPSDVGYSYTDGRKASTSEDVAKSLYDILQIFFTEFKQYANNDFHISGSGYSSRYIPALATHVVRENRYSHLHNKLPIRLASIIMGNGFINPRIQELSHYDYACNNGKPFFSNTTCQKMKNDLRRCKYLLSKCRNRNSGSSTNSISCDIASYYCKRTQLDPFIKIGLNPFDTRRQCNYSTPSISYEFSSVVLSQCYPIMLDIERYANRQDIKTEFGVDSIHSKHFQICNRRVPYRFRASNDKYLTDTTNDIEKLLATPVRILVYAGDMNWYNNWYGQRAWLSKLDWIGQVDFNEAEDKDWISYVSGARAGLVKSYLNLTFVRIFNAGHYAIYDQPANMIDLYSRWLMNMPLAKNSFDN
ncbi:MAG: Alpha/Beta hydrolase protein [Benjaminiella poitrasii]|nr:MAG: Alpha/Beta hydrolase protein [Benjaminiella poitrasii]